jgi:hypothetical protein
VRVEEIGLLWGNLRWRSRRAVARHVRRRYEIVDEEGRGGTGRRSEGVRDERRGPCEYMRDLSMTDGVDVLGPASQSHKGLLLGTRAGSATRVVGGPMGEKQRVTGVPRQH